jgi:DNA modification methylase
VRCRIRVSGPYRGRGGKGWYGGNAQSSVLHIPKPPASRDHPTMKPVELVRRCLLNSSREGERVLDPFCGSGTTPATWWWPGSSGQPEPEPGA